MTEKALTASKLEEWGALETYLARLESTFDALGDHGPVSYEARLALTLSRYAMHDLIQRRQGFTATQIVVLGPTQVGKSTLVNLLLHGQYAVPSPLAAYTEHLHGFACTVADDEFDRMNGMLESGSSLESVANANGQSRIVWDTPDFDSHRSHGFRKSIAKIIGYSDVLVVVVSKEKYADLTVWKMMHTLRQLQRPVVMCLNKVTVGTSVLVSELDGKLKASGWPAREVPVCTLPQTEEPVYESLSGEPSTGALLSAIENKILMHDPAARVNGVRNIIDENWQTWLQPVTEEIAADSDWQRRIESTLQIVLDEYGSRYLDHTRHYASFNRAILQLLELLEIPGLSHSLTKVRSVLTWPFRKLIGAPDHGDAQAYRKTESGILMDSLDRLGLTLRRTISEASVGVDGGTATAVSQAAHWWRNLEPAYRDRIEKINDGFEHHIDQYQSAFEPEIEAAAQRLYQHLQQSPATLNALRTARVAADAAGVVVAIKTGTIGATEALLTPAMLSLTSFLTEGAVGKYMSSVKQELKQRQYDRVKELFDINVRRPLLALPDSMPGDLLFCLNASDVEQMGLLKETF